MRTIQVARPRLELGGFVRCFAQREVATLEGDCEQSNFATLEQCIAFEFGAAMTMTNPSGKLIHFPQIAVVGSLTSAPASFSFSGRTVNFAILLKPMASWQLFRISPATLIDTDFEGGLLFGRGIKDLWALLAQCKTFAERVLVAENYFRPFALNALASTPIMRSAEHIILSKGATRVDDLANQTGLGVRQYGRQFVQLFGMGPKLFARVRRFQMALDIKRSSPQLPWLHVAHELGYHDQMHMIRDFHNLGGGPPMQTIDRMGDLQPWSVKSPIAAAASDSAVTWKFPDISTDSSRVSDLY